MTIRFPSLTKSSTSTTGTGTYTLIESGVAGYRTFTQAVSDSDLANGDQVFYIVEDTSVTNGPKLFETGIGTWNNTAKTLTRDTVLQPNGTAVDWGAGTRDVFVMSAADALVNLYSAQTIAGAKTFTSLLTAIIGGSAISVNAATAMLVQSSVGAASSCSLTIASGNAASAEVTFADTDAQFRGRVLYNHSSSPEKMEFYTAGSVRASISSAGLLNAAGLLYPPFAAGGVTCWGFYQAATPTGWTRVTTGIDGCAVRLATAGSPGTATTAGRSDIQTANTDAHALTTAELPAHTHQIEVTDGSSPTVFKVSEVAGAPSTGLFKNTESTGSNNGHSHGLSIKVAHFLLATLN